MTKTSTSPAAPNSKARVVVLGNCANQTSEYETTNFILDFGCPRILFDAGPGAVKQMLCAGFAAGDIDMVVLTHSHGDHTLGFPYFAFTKMVWSAPDLLDTFLSGKS